MCINHSSDMKWEMQITGRESLGTASHTLWRCTRSDCIALDLHWSNKARLMEARAVLAVWPLACAGMLQFTGPIQSRNPSNCHHLEAACISGSTVCFLHFCSGELGLVQLWVASSESIWINVPLAWKDTHTHTKYHLKFLLRLVVLQGVLFSHYVAILREI